MKVFQTMLDCEMGLFWISAIHEGGKVQSLTVHPIDEDGKIQKKLDYTAADLPDLTERIEREWLAEIS